MAFALVCISIIILLSAIVKVASEIFVDEKCQLSPGPSNIRCFYCHFTYNENAYNQIPDEGKDPACIPTPASVQKAGFKDHVYQLTPDIGTTIQCPHPDQKYCQVCKRQKQRVFGFLKIFYPLANFSSFRCDLEVDFEFRNFRSCTLNTINPYHIQ